MDSIMIRMETIINMINEENEELVSQQNKENEKFLICRICFDEDDTENLVSPCYCVGSHGLVHRSCLERWLSMSKRTSCDVCRYEFKTVEHKLTMLECFSAENSVQEFCYDFSACIVIVCVWILLALMCGLKAYYTFADAGQTTDSMCDGLLLSFITVIMIVLLCWWILLFQSSAGSWWKSKTVTRLESDHYNLPNARNLIQV